MEISFDLIIAGGVVVTGDGMLKADVGVKGEKVAAIAESLPIGQAKRVVNATGKLVLPGVIDVHVHPVYLDNIEACSRVAAYGGTTTLLYFAYARKGEDLRPALEKFLDEGVQTARTDFGLHCGLFDAPRQVEQIQEAMKLGVRSFKFFMPYIKQGWYTDDYHLAKAMDILAENGGLAMVHAENAGGIDYLEDKYLKGPGASPSLFNLTRPAALEEEATFRAICLAEVTGCPLYIPHVTAERALRPIWAARADGQVVYAETCSHYLSLTEEIIKTRGALAKVGPPIRSEQDRQALWAAMADNTLQVVSSDHAPKAKDPQGDFLEQGFGSPQTETLLPITYDEGINRGRISLVRLVQVLCENPARIFGLFPRKGTIAVGSDADLLVFDPARRFTINAQNQHSNVGYTLFDGRMVLGWPETTFQRGRPVLVGGEIQAQPGDGQFLEINPPGILI